jgi:hypothetical protein
MAIQKGNDRRVTGEDARAAVVAGLQKVLKETVDPASVQVTVEDGEITIDCVATGSIKKPRAAKPSSAA